VRDTLASLKRNCRGDDLPGMNDHSRTSDPLPDHWEGDWEPAYRRLDSASARTSSKWDQSRQYPQDLHPFVHTTGGSYVTDSNALSAARTPRQKEVEWDQDQAYPQNKRGKWTFVDESRYLESGAHARYRQSAELLQSCQTSQLEGEFNVMFNALN